MQGDTKVQLLAAGVLAASVSSSIFLSTRLAAEASRAELVYTTRAVEGQPPQVAAGIAMGAFRGIFVNFLWMRANELKEAGRYHESVELAKAITTLQPRFPRAWVFHAWNLAYNISVTTQTPRERWQWVRDGINILRIQGVNSNPNELLIYKELGWFFLHKVQGITDDANIYYKKMHAKEWQAILGAPPGYDPTIRDRAAASKRFADWLRPVAEAPGTMDALIAGPEGEAIAALVAELRALRGNEEPFGYEFLRNAEIDLAVRRSARRATIEKQFRPRDLQFRAIVDNPAYAAAWPRLLAFARAKVLREQYNMDPAIMVRFTEKYGPIDWRNPAAHGLYWSAVGVERAFPRAEGDDSNMKNYDFLNTDRVVVQSLQELYRTGTIYLDYLSMEFFEDGYYLATVEPSFVDTYGEVAEEVRQRSKFDQRWARGFSFYSAGRENFLRDAIRYFYRRGQRDLAEKYRQRLLTADWQNLNDPDRNTAQDLAMPLDDWVRKELVDRQTSPSVAISEIGAAVEGAVMALRNGDGELFDRQVRYAKDFFDYFRREQVRFTSVNPNDARMNILGDDFNLLVGSRFALMIQNLPLEDARAAYVTAPVGLRQYAFDILSELYKQELTEGTTDGGESFAQVFPEPPGMPEFRRRMDALREAQEGRPKPALELK